MGLCFLCSHGCALAWLLVIADASAAAAIANLALVFLDGGPLLPITVVGYKFLAISPAALLGMGLVGMTVTLSLKVNFCLRGTTVSGAASFVYSSASHCSAVLRYNLLSSLKPSMVAFSMSCFSC